MALDDLFAKKAKKKTKKKHNPQDLLEKLTKEVSKQNDQEGDVNNDGLKANINLGKDDEWEVFDDDDKEIDIQALQLGNLALTTPNELKQQPKEKPDKDGVGDTEEEKKVWGAKTSEPQAVEEPDVEEKPTKPSVYIPVHLRHGGTRIVREPKPNVESTADFPTLDAAVVPEPSASKAPNKSTKDEEDASWEQAGVVRKHPRTSDMLPIAVNPASSYVPPGLRAGATPSSFTPRVEPTFENRHHDEFVNRNESGYVSRRSEGISARDTSFSTGGFGGGWSRGETIARDSASTGTPMATPLPMSSRPSNTGPLTRNAGGGVSSGWERGVMKTFREGDRDKTEFQLVQSNRFAGLNET